MSLEINALWRVRPHRLGLSLISRGFAFRQHQYQHQHSLRLKSSSSSTTPASQVVTWNEVANKKLEQEKDGDDEDEDQVFAPFEGDEPLVAPEDLAESTAADDDILQILDESLTRTSFGTSVLVTPAQIHPTKGETRKSQINHHKSVTRQVRLEQIRIQTAKPQSDWRLVLQKLINATPDQPTDWHTDAVKMIVTDQALQRMLHGGGDGTIGFIRHKSGARVKVCERPGHSSLLLSGSAKAISEAADALRRSAGWATVIRLMPGPRLDISDTEEADAATVLGQDADGYFIPPLTRGEGNLCQPYPITHHVKELPKPKVWSMSSFERYIMSLVDAEIVPHLYSKVYNPKQELGHLTHDQTIIDLILEVFNDEAARTSLSCSAFKHALRFMSQRGSTHRPGARSLFVRVEKCRVQMDADVFNILLESSVKICDLRSFDTTLRLMVGRRQVPNLETWKLFLRLFKSKKVKWHILKEMNTKGLLHLDRAIQDVAKEMASFDADLAVTDNKDLPTFLAEQEARYGARWLTKDMANHILQVFASHGRFDDCSALLNHMAYMRSDAREAERASIGPTIVSFNTVITHSVKQKKRPVVMDMLDLMAQPVFRGINPDEVTYHSLFTMAWSQRLRTTLALIWRFASLARLTSWRMRHRVTKLLNDSGGVASELGTIPTCESMVGGPEVLKQLRLRTLKDDMGVASERLWAETYADWKPISASSLAILVRAAVERDQHAYRAKKMGKLYVKPWSMRMRLRPRDADADHGVEERSEDHDSVSEGQEGGESVNDEGKEVNFQEETTAEYYGDALPLDALQRGWKVISVMDAGHWADISSKDGDVLTEAEPSADPHEKRTEDELLAKLATLPSPPHPRRTKIDDKMTCQEL